MTCGSLRWQYFFVRLRVGLRSHSYGVRASPQAAPRPDLALIKAVARAHQWRKMLEGGEVTSIGELARRVRQDRGHVGLTLNLAFLSPVLTRAFLRGEQPPGLRLSHLLNADNRRILADIVLFVRPAFLGALLQFARSPIHVDTAPTLLGAEDPAAIKPLKLC